MKILKSVYLIINYKTIIITILSVASTYACWYYNITADFPLNLVGVAIVFPVVFSIDSAYKRRERALGYLADFKGHCLAIYHASRDWVGGSEEFSSNIKTGLVQLYGSVRDLFTSSEEMRPELEKNIYRGISSLSSNLQEIRGLGLQAGEVSRVSQYISKISIALENMRAILTYRTPITLRAYSRVFIYTFPILYSPYFVYAAKEYSEGLGFVMPILFSFILVSLDNIQVHLENPFDQVGEDDIKFDVEEFSEKFD